MNKPVIQNIYEDLISKFPKQHILVIGDLMVDEYIIGEINRISPEAPVQVVEEKRKELYPGGAGNVVRNLLTLGAEVNIISVIGDDYYGEWLKYHFAEIGSSPLELHTSQNRPTTVKKRVVVDGQQLIRIDTEVTDPIESRFENIVINYLRTDIGFYDAVLISDYGKGMITDKMMSALRCETIPRNIPVIVDPKGTNWVKYMKFSVISPNEKELAAEYKVVFQEEMKDEKDMRKIGKHLVEKLHLKALLVTRGKDGMVLFEKTSDGVAMSVIPTKARAVFDVTGAGDTALSVFGLSVAAGAEYFEATQLANFAAGVVVGKVGTSVVEREELLEKIKES